MPKVSNTTSLPSTGSLGLAHLQHVSPSGWWKRCAAQAAPIRHSFEDARLLSEQMLGYANHLGLYAEQTGDSGEALGNFPQAFTTWH